MIALLCQANALVGEAQNLKALPTGDVERLRTRYDTILTEAGAPIPSCPHCVAPIQPVKDAAATRWFPFPPTPNVRELNIFKKNRRG